MDTSITKVCSKCRERKPINEFGKDMTRADGHRYWCKSCSNGLSRKKYRNNPEPKLFKNHLWQKEHKKEEARRQRELRKKYPKRYAEINKKYKESHPEKVREMRLTWFEKHPQKKKEYNDRRKYFLENAEGKVTRKEWKELLDQTGHICVCCKKSNAKLTRDHVVPLSMGGKNTIENIQPLCLSCNAKKGSKTLDYR